MLVATVAPLTITLNDPTAQDPLITLSIAVSLLPDPPPDPPHPTEAKLNTATTNRFGMKSLVVFIWPLKSGVNIS